MSESDTLACAGNMLETEAQPILKQLDSLLMDAGCIIDQPLVVLNDDKTIYYANPAFLSLFQFSLAHTSGKNLYDLGNGLWDLPRLHHLLDGVLSQRNAMPDWRVEIPLEKSEPKSVRIKARRVQAYGGEADKILLVLEEAHHQQGGEVLKQRPSPLQRQVAQRTEQLQAEYDFIDTMLENQPAPMLVLDHKGRIVLFNKACEHASGYDFQELRDSTTWIRLVSSQERANFKHIIAQLQAGRKLIQHENYWTRKDGHKRLFSWNIAAVTNKSGQMQYVIASGSDVTAQREAEQQAHQSLEEAARMQRMLTANEMATTLAHELNQPLAAISMYADAGGQLLNQAPLDQEKLTRNLRQISEQAMRGGEVIRRLLAFVKQGTVNPQAVDLNALVRNAFQFMESRATKRNIRIELSLNESLPPVMAVAVHIEQVIFNLLRNAIDAIRDARRDDGRIEVISRPRGNMAHVTVQDNGGGIDADTATQLFESMFTTKSYGLGVGLRISRSLVEALGGRLWVEPRQPGGIFHFEIPLA